MLVEEAHHSLTVLLNLVHQVDVAVEELVEKLV